MIVKIDKDAVTAIETILKHGNKAVIQRSGNDVIVMEEKRKIAYRTAPSGEQERAI